jgi:hypothetical protein
MKTLVKPLLCIAKKAIIWRYILLEAKNNANPKWLFTMEKLTTKNSMMKNMTTKNVAIGS